MRKISINTVVNLKCRKTPSGSIRNLCKYLKTERGDITLYERTSPRIWTDGAMLEISDDIPSHVLRLVNKTTHQTDMQTFVSDYQSQLKKHCCSSVFKATMWDNILLIENENQNVRCYVSKVYVRYLGYRYPNADICVTSSRAPIAWVKRGQIMALTMPMAFEE